MLAKLALRNAQRSIRDYIVYLITVSLSFALIYSFNTLVFSEEIRSLNTEMDTMSGIILFFSAVVVLTVGWLVSYMTGFMLSRRSRELGTYMVLGISRKKISRLFLLENLILGALALLAGLLLGTVIYQLLVSAVANTFHLSYEIVLTFSPQALLLSAFYLLIIYIFATFRTGLKLRHVKICNLMDADRRQELPALHSRIWNLLLFFFSLILLGAGCVFLKFSCTISNDYMGRDLMIALVCLTAGIYGFYSNFSALIVHFLLRRKNFVYRGDRLILLRSLSARISSMGVTLGTLGILLMLTLTALQAGMELRTVFDAQAERTSPFDVLLYSSDGNFSAYDEYLDHEIGVEGFYEYSLRQSDSTVFTRFMQTTPLINRSYDSVDRLISISDYNALRRLKGLEPVVLEDGHYLADTLSSAVPFLEHGAPDLTLGGETLCYQASVTEAILSLTQDICVVPDEIAAAYPVDLYMKALRTARPTTQTDYDNLMDLAPARLYVNEDGSSYEIKGNSFRIKGSVESEQQTWFLTIAFAMFYVGLVFVGAAATILAVRQLSDTVRHKYRYHILSHLGLSGSRIDRLILRQLLIYFAVPLLLPVPLSIYAASCIQSLMMTFITPSQLWMYATIALSLFLLIYLIYYVATYVGCRKSVQGGWHPLD